ncbi:hypothetical protein KC19_12G171000 [Ceratodon purpureus]|uniref:3-dehydroquinate synthase C-terminal domain-containing protein n=1 Tax=Ceratodon purpureus TaxID=3225 RepID=A0A8T0GAR9_CERPU|nr:hypothetical protein KC19_12G171000 [Ceratodon purpureus]
MGRLRAADFDDYITQSQSCSHLSTPRSQGYLCAVERAKDRHHHHHHAASAEMRSTTSSKRSLQEKRNINSASLILLAFDASVKEAYAHTAIVWAMENALKRGDTLAIVAVCASVRGPLGYRSKIGDEKWQSANRALVEHEIRQKLELWDAFPGLQNRCDEGGVKLVVAVKAAQRPEVVIVREAVNLNATLVILDKSLKNRRREFYVENLSCGVTRMRQSGGVEIVRAAKLVENHYRPSSSPTSVLTPVPGFRYGSDELDMLAISLQPKRASTSRLSAHSTATSSMPSRRSCSSYFTEQDAAMDDDLFSIFHFGSPRHDTEFIESVLHHARSPHAPGYESDEPESSSPSRELLTLTQIWRLTFVVGLGECVEIHLRSALRQGEGLLVGASPSALFLLQQGHESSSRVVSAGTPACYIAMEGAMTMRLAHVESDQRVLAVDSAGRARTIAVRHAITHPQPLVLVEAIGAGDETRRHSVMLHHSQSVCLSSGTKSLSVKNLKVGDKTLLRLRNWHQP